MLAQTFPISSMNPGKESCSVSLARIKFLDFPSTWFFSNNLRREQIRIPYPSIVILSYHLCEKLSLVFFFFLWVKFPLDVITFSLLTVPSLHTKCSLHIAVHFQHTFENVNVTFAFHSLFKIQRAENDTIGESLAVNGKSSKLSVLTSNMGVQPRKTPFLCPAKGAVLTQSSHQTPCLSPSIRFRVSMGHAITVFRRLLPVHPRTP